MIQILMVAHGVSTDPAGSMTGLQVIADRIAGHLGDNWQISTAILSTPASFETAIKTLSTDDGPVWIWPHFMTSGWFVTHKLPRLLDDAGLAQYRILPPFGVMPGIEQDICAHVTAAMAADGRVAAQSDLLLVGHGSGKNPAVFDAMEAMIAGAAIQQAFRRVSLVHLEQAPFLTKSDLGDLDGVCLPLFAMTGGHVRDDIPPGLTAAGFTGKLLPPFGESAEAAAAIAAYWQQQVMPALL